MRVTVPKGRRTAPALADTHRLMRGGIGGGSSRGRRSPATGRCAIVVGAHSLSVFPMASSRPRRASRSKPS